MWEVEKKELTIFAEPKPEPVTITRSDEWKYIGLTKIKNTTDDRVEFHSVELELRFENSSVGPESNFHLKLETENQVLEGRLNRNGEIVFGGMKITILSGSTKSFRTYLRPEKEDSFYSKPGNGTISIINADASMISTFKSDSIDRSTGFRSAPIRVKNRLLTPIRFDP